MASSEIRISVVYNTCIFNKIFARKNYVLFVEDKYCFICTNRQLLLVETSLCTMLTAQVNELLKIQIMRFYGLV